MRALIVILAISIFSYLSIKSMQYMDFDPKPIVQIVNLTTGVRDEIPYAEWLDISRVSTGLPVPNTYVRHLTWSKCRKIDTVLVQSFKNMPPAITILYKDVCR